MSLPIKLGLTTASLGVAGGLGYAGIKYLNKEEEPLVTQKEETKISALIEEGFKYKLLDTNAEDEATLAFWKINSNSYNKDNAESEQGQDPFKLTGWKRQNSTDLTSELKKECEKASLKSVNDKTDPVYKNVEKYCTRGVTVKEDAEKKGKEIVKTDGSSSAIWSKRESNKENLKTELGKLGVAITSEDQITASTIKEGCVKSVNKNKKDDANYTEVYAAYEKICTKQEGDS